MSLCVSPHVALRGPEVALAVAGGDPLVAPPPGLHRQEVGDVRVDEGVASLNHVGRHHPPRPPPRLPGPAPARLPLPPALVQWAAGERRGEAGLLGRGAARLRPLQLHPGLARRRGDADADVRAALRGLPLSMLSRQDTPLLRLHQLRLRPFLQVLQPPEDQTHLGGERGGAGLVRGVAIEGRG